MDIKEAAFFVIENFLLERETEGEAEENSKKVSRTGIAKSVDIHQAAVTLGARGGEEGGPARQRQMTKNQRKALAKKAAEERWGPHKQKHRKKKRWEKKRPWEKHKKKTAKKKEDEKSSKGSKNESYMIWEEPGPRAILRDDGHYDTHGLTKAHLDYIASHPEVLAAKGPVTLTLPSHLAPLKNALVGPSSGDSPVGEHQVHYKSRGGGRNYNSRMMRGSPRETRMVTAISVPDQKTGRPFLVTAWGGPLSPKEVDDPSHTPESRAEAKKFWSQHALLDG